jgi:hypothetical protein
MSVFKVDFMRRFIAILFAIQFMFAISFKLHSQSGSDLQEFGITTGGFTNFPANQNYMKDYMNAIYLSPYVRTGQHEFSAGILFPLKTHALNFQDNNIDPRLGFIAGYKFYVFNIYGRENMFIHYAFEYLRFEGDYVNEVSQSIQTVQWTEKDMYINNVIGLGYNLFFDYNRRFGLYYTLDYLISQASYKLSDQNSNPDSWTTKFVWNNLSTHFGLIFKLTSLKKKEKK